jgi:hypothetical protein
MYERVSLVYSFAWFDPLFSLEYVLYVGVEIPDLCMNENDVYVWKQNIMYPTTRMHDKEMIL